MSASPPSGYGDTDGGEGGFGGASNDAGFGNNPISSTTYSSDGNNDGFGPFGSDDNDRTPALSSSTAKVADSIPTPPGQEPAEPVHSYDEVGTNVLMANDQGFVAVRGTDDDDVIEVRDNDYNREVVINDDVYIAPREPGHGITLFGGAGDDTLTGTDFVDAIFGGAGDDTIRGLGSSDRLAGQAGNDTVYGGYGRDDIRGGPGDDLLYGNEDGDRLAGASGDDVLHGGIGDDLLIGSDGNDELFGDDGRDRLIPGAGDDLADGGNGADLLDETVITARGEVFGGNDTLRGGNGNDVIRAGIGDDTISGDAGRDYVNAGPDSDKVDGGDGNDVIYASVGEDLISGGPGNDYLDGGEGDDALFGNEGADILSGGYGRDHLDGGNGTDTLIGGPGNDGFGDSNTDPDRVFAEPADQVELSDSAELIEVTIDSDLIRNTVDIATNDAQFAGRVGADLTTLGSFPGGQELLRSIGQSGKTVVIQETESADDFSGIGARVGVNPGDWFLNSDGSPGAGADALVLYNPRAKESLVADSPPIIELVHELIHADHFVHGLADPGYSVEVDKQRRALTDMRTGEAVVSPDFELQAVGAPYDQDGNQDQPFKSDTPQASSASELEPNTMPISEATFRAELQMEPRPNYTLSNAQRRLGDGEVGRYSVENATDMGNVRLPVEQAVARPSLTMNEPGSSDGNYQPISTVGTDESEAQPTSPMPKVSTVSSSSPSPGLCVDHDGDGWGWDGQHSCKSTAATARYPKCADGAASDSDDDGYGWEHYKTCLV